MRDLREKEVVAAADAAGGSRRFIVDMLFR
jgi:hypothetical protein